MEQSDIPYRAIASVGIQTQLQTQSEQQTANREQRTANSELRTANGQWLTANG
jgi:hypothetical protein